MAVQKLEKIAMFDVAPEGECLGAGMMALPVCLKSDEIMPLLERHGFANIDPERWYPQQNIADLYKDILEGRSNVSENLVSIGIKSVETIQFPPELDTMTSILNTMAGSYGAVHRNLQPGEGTWVKFLGEGHAQVIINTPYPEDIFYGYYWGIMKKYTPEGMQFRVAMVDNHTDQPGTVYDLKWGKDI